MITSKVCQGLKYLDSFNYRLAFAATSAKPSKPLYYYYDVLNVKEGFTPQQLKSAYLEMVKKWHPDLSKDPKAAQKFQQVQTAYDVLQNPQNLRKQPKYDKRSYNEEGEELSETKASDFHKNFHESYSRKKHANESMHFSYNLYKKHYEQMQEKKMQYHKYAGQYRQQYAHKSEKGQTNWPTLGIGAAMIGLIVGSIYFVNAK